MLTIWVMFAGSLVLGGALVVRERRERRVPSAVRVAQVRAALGVGEPGKDVMVAPAGVRTLSVEMIK